jgi:sn-glycerol 3-phosphate transport system substrate-binding protein
MTIRRILLASLAATALAFGAVAPARAATDIQLWHAMDGALGAQLDAIVQRFNAAQSDFRVVAVYKGSYDETLAAGLAARLQGSAPHILQVYDVGTANMAAAKNAIRPVHQVMREAGEKLDASAFVPAVASFYSDSKGNLLALPFNTSTPVLYVNRDVFDASGVDARKPIKTWYDLQDALLEVREKSQLTCGLTTTWPSWVMLENTLAWHNEEFATRNNGYDGLDAQLVFNTRLAIRHLSLMTAWSKSHIFTYSGRRDEGERRFARGECASLTASSASYANVAQNARFRFAVLPLPHYDDINKAPYNTLMGGAGLWVLNGKGAREYKGVAKFFAFVSQPEVQAQWHQATGYLPITRAAYEITKAAGFYQKHPGADVGVQQMTNGSGLPQPYSRGIRLGNHLMIRAVVDEELEQTWSLQKPPKQALDDAVRRGNDLLRRFERANK